MSASFITGYSSLILCLPTLSTLTSNNCAAVACLNNSCNLSGVLATVIAPFCFNPVDNPVFFSNSLFYRPEFLTYISIDNLFFFKLFSSFFGSSVIHNTAFSGS